MVPLSAGEPGKGEGVTVLGMYTSEDLDPRSFRKITPSEFTALTGIEKVDHPDHDIFGKRFTEVAQSMVIEETECLLSFASTSGACGTGDTHVVASLCSATRGQRSKSRLVCRLNVSSRRELLALDFSAPHYGVGSHLPGLTALS